MGPILLLFLNKQGRVYEIKEENAISGTNGALERAHDFFNKTWCRWKSGVENKSCRPPE